MTMANTIAKKTRRTIAQIEADLRESLGAEYAQRFEEDRDRHARELQRVRDEHQAHLDAIRAGHSKQLKEIRTEVLKEIEETQQLNRTIIEREIEARVLEELVLEETSHYESMMLMLASVESLDVKTSENGDRKYIRIGDLDTYCVWSFTLDGRFVYQSQYQF